MRSTPLLCALISCTNASFWEYLNRDGLSPYIAHGLDKGQASDPKWSASDAQTSEATTTITITSCGIASAEAHSNYTSSSVCSQRALVTSLPTSAGSTSATSDPSSTPQPVYSSQTSVSTLTSKEQVGDSVLGTLSQPVLPRWLNGSDGEPYVGPPWGNRTTQNSDATIKSNVPNTNVTRQYNFTISRSQISPDGVLRDTILVNQGFPGPAIEANWGDWIEVTVYNNITNPEEGSAMHWHGMLQRGSQWEDGVPSISQCPIAPGQSYTYRFRAEVYGTSFYHAHYSAQYTAGVVGPMVVYGPWQSEYDVDLGPVMLSDWNHIPYFSMVTDVVGTDLSKIPPLADNGLINGRGRFDCSNPSYSNSTEWLGSNLSSNLTWTCVDGAERAKFKFQSGKTHRLRVMNTGADGVQKFSIDGHTMTVIATDYVPVTPYTTDVVTLGVGQRTDVLVTASQDAASSWWMRTIMPGQASCGGLGVPSATNGSYPEVLAAIYYESADTAADPTSNSSIATDISCSNQPLEVTQPAYAIAPSAASFYQSLVLGITLNSTGSFNFLINNQTYRANFNEPLLYSAAAGITSFPDNPEWNVYDFGSNSSIVLNITNETPFYHPFHLHGHTFFVLDIGEGTAPPPTNGPPAGATGPPAGIAPGSGPPVVVANVWNGSVVNPANPMRRDVQMVPAGGYAVIQFEADSPGVWPFHCHSAWHLSGGLGMNIVTQASEITGIPAGTRESTCNAWDAYSSREVVDQIDAGS